MTSRKNAITLNTSTDSATVELRVSGSDSSWIAQLFRGTQCLYWFLPVCSSPEEADMRACAMLESKLASALTGILGDTLDVRALALVKLEKVFPHTYRKQR